MILGFAVGAGYSFHEEALWERGAASGFDLVSGVFVPSIFQQDGAFVVGQAVWTSLIGLAIGLIILHRRHPLAVVGAAVAIVAVVSDHMSVNATGETLDAVRQLLFNGAMLALVFFVGVVAAVVLDRNRLAAISARDHLFPSDWVQGSRGTDRDAHPDPLHSMLASRYRRLRNGVHTTVDATTQQWPPRCETHSAPIAELTQLGRAADVAVGPGTSPSGWAPDPESPDGFRFVGHHGFTAYAAGSVRVEAVVPAFSNPGIDEEHQALLAKEVANGSTSDAQPTVTSISIPKARTEAKGIPEQVRAGDFWQFLGLGVVAVALYISVRLMTAGTASSIDLETALSLPDATNNPALILGVLGALAAAVSIRGRDAAEPEDGWAVGPGYDPSPDRPDECEA